MAMGVGGGKRLTPAAANRVVMVSIYACAMQGHAGACSVQRLRACSVDHMPGRA